MIASLRVRRALVAGGLLLLAGLAGCSDSGPTAPLFTTESAMIAPATMPTAADIVVPGPDAGAFVNAIVPNESGWLTTEFWDNPSDDATAPGEHCNVGYFATGVMGVCGNEVPGSDANQGGYAKYWGDGTGNRNPSSFMFNGAFAYRVTLLGSYAQENSELGWFTVSSGTYTFHPVTAWGTKTIDAFAFIPAGANWGLYLKHSGHGGSGTCAANTDCSDATGDMHTGTTPAQQFALFTNAGESLYLVGVEDNDQGAVGIGDDDFQDFLFSVEPFQAMFVIGDAEPHDLTDPVYFWGAQWWKNNTMSGLVSSGVAAFKGYASLADNYCGGTWSTDPGNSPPPPVTIPADVLVIVTSTVLKAGPVISGDIQELLLVHHDGNYSPNPGHAGRGPVTEVICQVP